MPLVSIIMATYNNEKTIGESIESINNQTFSDYELIICDDGSTDTTSDVVASFQKKNSRIRYLKITHTGEPAKVWNAAVKHAQGKYIAFLDSDDLWLANKLHDQVNFYEQHTQLGYVFCDTADYLGDDFSEDNFDGTFVHKFETFSKIMAHSDIIISNNSNEYIFSNKLFEFILNWGISVTSAFILKRSIFDELNGYNEDYKLAQSLDLMLQICKKYPIGYIDQIGVKRRRHKKSITMGNTRRFSSFALKILLEHMPPKDQYLDKSKL